MPRRPPVAACFFCPGRSAAAGVFVPDTHYRGSLIPPPGSVPMKRTPLFGLLLSVALVGCGGPPPDKVEQPKSADQLVTNLKNDLGAVAQSGEGGSGLDSIRFAYNDLKTKDAAKAKAVEKDIEALLKTGKVEDRKKHAAAAAAAL